MGGLEREIRVDTYDIPLCALLIEQFTSLRHRHPHKLILTVPSSHPSLSASTRTATREHLQRLHRRPRTKRFCRVGLASSTPSTGVSTVVVAAAAAAVHGLVRADRLLLVHVGVADVLLVRGEEAERVAEERRVA